MEDPKLAQAIESIAPLLVRANVAAKRLSEARYDDEPQWRVEAMIRVTHGITDLEEIRLRLNVHPMPEISNERCDTRVRIKALSAGRWFNLDEAEAIVRELLGK